MPEPEEPMSEMTHLLGARRSTPLQDLKLATAFVQVSDFDEDRNIGGRRVVSRGGGHGNGSHGPRLFLADWLPVGSNRAEFWAPCNGNCAGTIRFATALGNLP